MDCPETKEIEAAVAYLPDDALEGILSHLRAKPLFRFKCASKAWCGLIADRLRCRKFPQNLEGFFIGGRGENYGHFIDLSGRPVPLVDPSFSFLTKVPEIEKIVLLGSCNGLVLFGHRQVSDNYDSLGYIVCNPATEQWVTVPSSGWTPLKVSEDEEIMEGTDTYLIFDPAVSSHFQLVQLSWVEPYHLVEVNTSSSVTGVWREHEDEVIQGQVWRQWGIMSISSMACPFNGMLHVSIHFEHVNQNMVVAIDGEAVVFKTMHWPDDHGHLVFVGQAQGHLHCMSVHKGDHVQMAELSIWVLEDYDAEKWVLRDNVSFFQLFGKISRRFRFNVVAIHPYHGLVFFVKQQNWRLISYDMETKEVCALCALGHGYRRKMTPYVPYFAELAALTKKHLDTSQDVQQVFEIPRMEQLAAWIDLLQLGVVFCWFICIPVLYVCFLML